MAQFGTFASNLEIGTAPFATDGSGVLSFNTRTGAVVGIQADYDAFFLTPAEGDAAYRAIGATTVDTFAGRSGTVLPIQADYDGFFLTPAEGDAAYAPILVPAASIQAGNLDLGINLGAAAAATNSNFKVPFLNTTLGVTGNFGMQHDSEPTAFTYNPSTNTFSVAIVAATTVNATLFNGVALTTGGVATNYLDETGAYSVPVGSGPAPVTSVFGRVGIVTALQADYDSFFLTPAEGNAAYRAIGATTVDTFIGRSGAVVALQADYDAFFLTPTEGNAAYGTLAATNLNTAKVTNATHTGQILGSTALSAHVSLITAQTGIAGALIGTDTFLVNDGGLLREITATQMSTFFGASAGNVSNTGTPINNQVAVWTDATTIEGDIGLQYSAGQLDVGQGTQQFRFTMDATFATILSTGASPKPLVITAPDIRINDELYLLERAAAAADIATYGQVWVNDLSFDSNSLMFTNDLGQDFDASKTPVGARKLSGTDRASDITPTDDPVLTVNLPRRGIWFIRWLLYSRDLSGSSNGMRIQFSSSGVSTQTWNWSQKLFSGAGALTWTSVSAGATQDILANTSGAGTTRTFIETYIESFGAGVVTLQWAQQNSNITAVRMDTDSAVAATFMA